MRNITTKIILVSWLLACAPSSSYAQSANSQQANSAAAGMLERIKVHGASLDGNLEGDDPNRDVIVYLPPSYTEQATRRYPVVYFLHGYGLTADGFVNFVRLPGAADQSIENGAGEMIIVLPDAYSVYSGSMYSNSPTTGDWESFIARDLVAYIDSHYRTIAQRESRGLAGHSMGGYGTVRIGMKHPEAFTAMFAMSSCCLMNRAPSREQIEAQIADRGDAPAPNGGFANVLSAQAAAWAPNPDSAPRYFDWPYENGEALPLVQAKWIANSPLVMVDQYVPNLQRYSAIYIDVGDADTLRADNERLTAALTRLDVEHTFELYEGDHINRVAARLVEDVLPFFSQELEFE